MHLATNSSGQFRVCCHALPEIGLLRGENGQALRAERDPIEKVWSSPTYKTIRRQMLEGERPELCRRCFREEDAGVTSFRQAMNGQYLARISPTVDENGVAPLNVRYVDLRLGNLCNLRCRMCNPWASNQWLKEWNQIAEQPLAEDQAKWLTKMHWPEDPRVWQLMESVLESVEEIYLTGGEPTLIKQQVPLLQACVDRGMANKITLKYNTNLTYVPENLVSLWAQFKTVRLHGSVDGFGDLNDYIRHPSEWAVIDRNLRRVVELARRHRIKVQVHTTVQAYNLLHLSELFDYLAEFDLFPYLNILDRPAHLNVRILPQALKDQAVKRLSRFMERPKVRGLIQYLNEDWSNLLPDFRRYTSELDRIRGQSFSKLSPHVSGALGL